MAFPLIPIIMAALSSGGGAAAASGAGAAAGGAGAAGAAGGAAGGAGGAGGFASLLGSLGGSSGAGGASGGGGIMSMLGSMGGGGGGGAPGGAGGGGGGGIMDSLSKGPSGPEQESQNYAPVANPGPRSQHQNNSQAFIPGKQHTVLSGAGYLKHAVGKENNFATGGGALSQAYNVYKNGNLVHGSGDGTSDSIPANLSNHEYVLTASDVSRIGNGDTESGARRLDEMRAAIARDAGAKQFQPQIKHPIQYLRSAK